MKTSKNILLVEDDKDDQFIFMSAVSKIENAILQDIASNGKEALGKLENSLTLPDLIFMDINMPTMTGIECLAEIIKNPQLREIPVVILSADTADVELVRNLGAKAFIKKPSDETILLTKLEQMINLDFMVNSNTADQTFQSALSPF